VADHVDVCYYCGERNLLTREHADPAWVYRQLGIEGVPAQLLVNNRIVGDADVLGVTIYALCRECNWTWSIPEQRVRKWLGKSMRDWSVPSELGPGQRRLVATWAVKTALMLELALRYWRTPSFSPHSHFCWLYERRDSLEPPLGCRVWIFGNDRDARTPTTCVAMVLALPTGHPPTAYLATFTIGFMGFQVFGPDAFRWEDHSPTGQLIAERKKSDTVSLSSGLPAVASTLRRITSRYGSATQRRPQ
jgi:hypothetical protein